ncbi:hypothetical protein [Amycolatopsis anabasis]|uniref:hypothetical protein n=1 Tax=Amycolatopsis anabasis TaxID=1840409 RepID=UPI00131C1BBC|nr:hypothetical protein [Amycolatopsis anabasis]
MADPDAQGSGFMASVGAAVGAAVGGVLSKQAIEATKTEARKLTDSARSGGFAISEQGADEYIRVFREFEDALDSVKRKLDTAGQEPKLGGSNYATLISDRTRLMASGDEQSYETQLTSLGEIVRQAREAFELAKKQYSRIDGEGVQTFGGVRA